MEISDMLIGDYLTLGKFRARGNSAPRSIQWIKASMDNIFIATSGISPFCLDAREPNNESEDRRDKGSNFYPQTNLAQFLNSAEYEWYKPQHESDEVDLSMKAHPGFLYGFQDWERDLLIPQTFIVTVPNGFRRKYGQCMEATMLVTLPSKSQMVGGDDTEGKQLDFFAPGTNFVTTITRTACNSGVIKNDSYGKFKTWPPASCAPITPLIRIKENAEIIYDGSADSYIVLPTAEIAKSITDELHLLFN